MINKNFLDPNDTLEMGRPNAVVISPNMTITDEQMMTMQDEAMRQIQQDRNEIQKRFALMQKNDCFYCWWVCCREENRRKENTEKWLFVSKRSITDMDLSRKNQFHC